MIDEGVIKKLKQTNVSTNPTKTKKRVYELWKSSSKAKKRTIEETAGISRATIYRVYNTGSVSAKLAVPMSQNFNVDPYYLIGETDIASECTEEILIAFLKGLGYEKVLNDAFKKQEKDDDETMQGVANAEVKFQNTFPEISANDLTLADLHLLMQSLLLRERAGIEDAVKKAAKLRGLLLS
ncbi:MAG: hypothetical protein FWC91_08865 [Defluviitaleaceae bacterium]|nr:hypothetical protein [Defluviitaleaceae bacterium]